MIFNFRIVSDEVDNFRREINIDADSTFMDLKNAICDSVSYDKSQMCSFFLCNDGWEKGREITMEDMGSDSDQDIYLMDETILCDYLDDRDKLIWVFDYFTDRCMFMELRKSIPGQNLQDPVCVASMGTPPPQIIDLDDFDAATDAKATKISAADDMDEDFYGSDSYNDDEFGPDGFDELTFDDEM